MTILSAVLTALVVITAIVLAEQRGKLVHGSTCSAALATGKALTERQLDTMRLQHATIQKQSAVMEQQSALITTIERQRDEAIALTKSLLTERERGSK